MKFRAPGSDDSGDDDGPSLGIRTPRIRRAIDWRSSPLDGDDSEDAESEDFGEGTAPFLQSQTTPIRRTADEDVLPSLENLHIIYPSPREKLQQSLRRLRSDRANETTRLQRQDPCRLIRQIQRGEPLLEAVEKERKQMVEKNVKQAMAKLLAFEEELAQRHTNMQAEIQKNVMLQQHSIREQAQRIRQREERARQKIEDDFRKKEMAQLEMMEKTAKDLEERHRLQEKIRQEQLAREEAARKRQEQEEQRKREELQRQQEQVERKRKEEEERKAKEEQARRQELERREQEAAEKQKQLQVDQQLLEKNYGSPEAIAHADEQIGKVKEVKETIDKQVKANKQMFNEALKYRMKFTTKVGAVTNSRKHILQFASDLNDTLATGKNTSELLYKWLLNNLAKQFVKQAESEVSVNTKKAFPLAAMCCLLFTKHSDLISYILGRLYKKCPYVVPRYPRRLEGESNDDLRKKMGYKIRDLGSGEWETEEQFQERMNGMVAFYGALWQTNLQSFGAANPYGISHGWSFLARMLNMTPRKITPSLLETLLKTCGHSLLQQYGTQAHKLMRYIRQQYLPKLQEVKGGESAKVRLELMLDEYARTGSIPPPEGIQFNP